MAGDEERQLSLPGFLEDPEFQDLQVLERPNVGTGNQPTEPDDIHSYEEHICLFSAGKDSVACVLHLLELGVPKEKIHLHHHLVDGPENDLMDWPCTEAYCKAFAKALGLRISFSWRRGGFRAEMLRQNQPTAPSVIPLRDGSMVEVGGAGPCNTRMKFPQVSANLGTRYCSSYLKIGVSDAWFCNDPTFSDGKKRLVISGERAEESSSRAKYKSLERHRKDNRDGRTRRFLDHWRPIHKWPEAMVWDIMKRHSVNSHPAYWLGLGRCSCRGCVFASPSQWATLRHIDRKGFGVIASYEQQFGVTIDRVLTVTEKAERGSLLPGANTRWAQVAMSRDYEEPIIVDNWQLPPGAFGENAGPC